MNQEPLVSAIIPTFNRGHMLGESIKSVLNQSYKNIEIIVVDDASQDNPKEIIKSFVQNIHFISLKTNKGAAAARNKGIDIAKGDFIAFLDSDDIWYPTKIEKQVSALKNTEQNVGFNFCNLELIDFKTKEEIKEVKISVNLKNNFTRGSYFLTPQTSSLLIKKNALYKIGGFDEKLPAHQDTELAIRLCKYFDYEMLDEALVKVTRNHQQMMNIPQNYIIAKEIILDKHKDFLSKKILFSLSKQITNYYILTNNYVRAKKYVDYALRFNPKDITTKLQKVLFSIAPFSIRFIYKWKHQRIPNTSGLEK